MAGARDRGQGNARQEEPIKYKCKAASEAPPLERLRYVKKDAESHAVYREWLQGLRLFYQGVSPIHGPDALAEVEKAVQAAFDAVVDPQTDPDDRWKVHCPEPQLS